MGKFYLLGFVIFIVSLIIIKVFVPSHFWGNNYFLAMAMIIIYLGVFFGSLISFLEEFFPKSKITKFIKKLYDLILGGL